MSHFIYDKTGLSFPKSNARPLRVPPDQGIVAAEWNQVCQGLTDVQNALLAARFLGLTRQALDPAPAAQIATDYLWVDTNNRLRLHAGGADRSIGIGQTGQAFINIVPAGARATHDSATPLVVFAFAFDPTAYTLASTTRSIVFRALASSGNAAKTVHVKLRNLTDGEDVTGANLSTTSASTVKLEATLTEGAGAGQVKPVEKVYEVRIWVDAPAVPTDTVELYGAELRVVSTIQ